MELAAFERATRPLSVHLDEVLKKMNVESQSYHENHSLVTICTLAAR